MELPLSNHLPPDLKEGNEIRFKSSIASSLNTLNIIKERRAKTNATDLTNNILNFSQYLLINQMDLLCTLRKFFTSETVWEINFNCRTCCLVLYEFLYCNPILWKDLEGFITNNKTEYNTKALKDFYEELRLVKRENKNLLEKIRHNVIAHKNKNAREQLEIIEKLDVTLVTNLNLKMVSLLSDLTKVITDAINLSNSKKGNHLAL